MILKLKKLEVEGFRAFSERIVVEFGENLTIIYGPPASGKTSLIRAIEFALFGMTRELPSRALRREDLINDLCEEARVEVVITDGQRDISALRTLNRHGKSSLIVRVGGNEFREEAAEHYLSSKLKCSLEDFVWELSVGYQELHTLLYAPPAEQGRLIDALLGISDVEELFEEISAKDARELLNTLEEEERRLGGAALFEELERLRSRYASLVRRRDELITEIEKLEARKKVLEEAYSLVRASSSEIEKLRIEANRLREILKNIEYDKSFQAYEVDKNYILKLTEYIRSQLSNIIQQCFLGESIEIIKNFKISFDNITEFIDLVKKIIERVDSECIARLTYEYQNIRNYMARIQMQVSRLEEELSNIRFEIEKRKAARMEYDQFVRMYGDSAALAKRIAQLEIELKARQKEEGKLRCAHVLQSEILEALKTQGSVICPICGRELKSVSDLPRAEAYESLRLKRERVERELEELRSVERKMRELELTLKLLSDYEEKEAELEEELENTLSELEEMKESYDELEERISTLKSRTLQLARDCERLEKFFKALQYIETRERLRKIENKLNELVYEEENIKKIIEELDKIKSEISVRRGVLQELEEQERDLAHRLKECDLTVRKLKILKEKQRRLQILINRIENIRKAIANTHFLLRQKLADRLSEEIGRLFKELASSSGYDSFSINIENLGIKGFRSRYALLARRHRNGKTVPVATRFSDGQKTLFALALYLAARRLKPQNLALCILDDPAPNVDEETKVLIARVLLTLSGDAQFVLTTQSERVARELASVARVLDLRNLLRQA